MADFIRRRTSALALLLYAGFVVYQSLADGGAWQRGGTILSTDVRLSRSDLLANVVAYVPLGLLWLLATTGPAVAGWRRMVGRGVVGLLVIAVLSCSLEVLQAWQSARMSSAYDLAANVTGGGLGIAAALLLRTAAGGLTTRAIHIGHTPDAWLRASTAAVAGGWVMSQTMPWVFAVDVGTLRSNLSFLQHWGDGSPLDAWRVVRHAGAWMAVACACRLVARDPKRAAAGLVSTGGVSLFLQILLDARAPLSFEELIGMGVSAVLVVPLMLRGKRQPAPGRWAVGLFFGAVLTVAAYELRPDPSAAVTAQGFSWWPRVGLGGPLGALDYALLFGWFGMTAVVAGRWGDVAGYWRARRLWPGLAILAMLGLEILQIGIPGRGPDISAPLFTLLAVLGTDACVEYAAVRLHDGAGPATRFRQPRPSGR